MTDILPPPAAHPNDHLRPRELVLITPCPPDWMYLSMVAHAMLDFLQQEFGAHCVDPIAEHAALVSHLNGMAERLVPVFEKWNHRMMNWTVSRKESSIFIEIDLTEIPESDIPRRNYYWKYHPITGLIKYRVFKNGSQDPTYIAIRDYLHKIISNKVQEAAKYILSKLPKPQNGRKLLWNLTICHITVTDAVHVAFYYHRAFSSTTLVDTQGVHRFSITKDGLCATGGRFVGRLSRAQIMDLEE